MKNPIAINETPRNITVTLTLTGADYEWLAAYAQVKGHSMDDAATKMIVGSLNEEPIQWFDIQRLLNRAEKQSAPKKTRSMSKQPPVTDGQLQEVCNELDLAGRIFKVNQKSKSALRRPGMADRLRARALGIKLTGGEFFHG
jgi:hypothetical protein